MDGVGLMWARRRISPPSPIPPKNASRVVGGLYNSAIFHVEAIIVFEPFMVETYTIADFTAFTALIDIVPRAKAASSFPTGSPMPAGTPLARHLDNTACTVLLFHAFLQILYCFFCGNQYLAYRKSFPVLFQCGSLAVRLTRWNWCRPAG